MPPKKPKQKSFKSSSALKSTAVSSPEPPKPYGRPNPKIEPFLEKLSKRHVYITHIDTKPADFKYKIFSVPVMMNLFIIAGILWRIYHIGPWYMKICWSVSGKYNETTIDTYNIPVEETIKEIVRRAAVFMIDLCIYVFIWPWPRDFWLGRRNGQFDNPITWRYYTGFRNTDIVVRRSRRWDVIIKDPLDDEHEGTKELLANLHAAVDPMWMSEKTGYLMLNKWWDLDWNLMIEATKLADEKKVPLDEFRTTIFVYTEDFGWVVIENSAARGTAKEEEGRLKIIAFKDELTAMGKENVFFRWIELVQFESSQPGGFGPERQAATMVKAKTMFEEQGIDFDAFWAKIGGMQGMPGLDDL